MYQRLTYWDYVGGNHTTSSNAWKICGRSFIRTSLINLISIYLNEQTIIYRSHLKWIVNIALLRVLCTPFCISNRCYYLLPTKRYFISFNVQTILRNAIYSHNMSMSWHFKNDDLDNRCNIIRYLITD